MGESSNRKDPVRYCFVFDNDRPDLIGDPSTEVVVELLQLKESLLRSLTTLSLRAVLLSTVEFDVAFDSVVILRSCDWSDDSADPLEVLCNMLYSRADMFLTSPSTMTMCLLLLIE